LIDLLNSDVETSQIPTWLATTGSQHTLDLAVKHGHGLLIAAHGSKLAQITDYAHAQAPQLRVALARAVHVAASRQAAEREIRPHLAWYIEQLTRLQPGAPSPTLNDVLNTFCVVGTDQECRRKLHALRVEYRVTDLIGVFGIGGMDPAAANRALRSLAAAEVEYTGATP
jgi:alkanesulfonate monooxygenase SsuD/methylene tetrahydromethanopterin reductase-like flavin-dependent oxidoreductase (luciferase family)